MATQNHTVTKHSCALNAVDLIIVRKERKSKGTPTNCALYGGNHTANYKVCEYYHNKITGKNKFENNTQRTTPLNSNIYSNNIVLTHNNKEVTQM
jgi:hypothetical protein